MSCGMVYEKYNFLPFIGDFPSISLMQVLNGSDITYTVTEDIKGQPDLDTVSLTIGGSVSLPFSASSLSQITV
ncbi:hypothetical protein DPMN_079585 [Dreissena polymorpha]|uniref:Uncharacterized protein n=1 Tax=Dreissena polymorpha TaxID=45954 RepID=A0A9D3YTF4_DREPO|nr:hypothetical protein DPMN_079585 [Dreissena polymorpha]